MSYRGASRQCIKPLKNQVRTVKINKWNYCKKIKGDIVIYSCVSITDKLHLWRETKLVGNKTDLCHTVSEI